MTQAIVSGWLSDLSNTGSPHADALLVNFYRWVCARESLLQDPALHRLVHRLMHKVNVATIGIAMSDVHYTQ
jgi:DNA polymerase epsilon subunit 1